MAANQPPNIPILTDVIAAREHNAESRLSPAPAEPPAADGSSIAPPDTAAGRPDHQALIAELQTRLASATFALTEELIRAAFSEMEANLHRQVCARLRRELPELIDSLLREHLDIDRDV